MPPITALEAVQMLRILGLSVRIDGAKLFVSPVELVDEDVAWIIRKHRDGILAELENDSPAWAWVVRFDDGTATEIYLHPERTHAQMLLAYPSAESVERLPECAWPRDSNKTEEMDQ